MKIYHTRKGEFAECQGRFFSIDLDWDTLLNQEDLLSALQAICKGNEPERQHPPFLPEDLLPPLEKQEVWASGVTYFRSKEERQKESEKAGGSTYYEKVYQADRPELFFKATRARTVGPGQAVRIRKDSDWNVPEPELTLVINSRAQIVGYTLGNDMSSRSIEGENPLYLTQAKVYDGAAAVGPCVWVPEGSFDLEQEIELEIARKGETVFRESIRISQMKRSFEELVHYLFLECSFPYGCLLMTGTGIIPPPDFSLRAGDKIHISLSGIGTLKNHVA